MFAPRISRRLVYELCDSAGLPEVLVDDAAFVIGELVTESIRQSRRDVEVEGQLTGQQITVRVRNAKSSAPPIERQATNTPTRNSATVRHLAASWGCCRYQYGWEVWAVLRSRP
ncbi:ATP-binding protein [Mycolicibacterium sp. P9-64]|uniref:ATP-binding protein n=1 Tax=Mycolicibacterium sp. P9-64 TaxID=2024612 RepID=UPI0011ED3242|nr:ATP-binding protein [Mycolicibacterium sp. P9-64]